MTGIAKVSGCVFALISFVGASHAQIVIDQSQNFVAGAISGVGAQSFTTGPSVTNLVGAGVYLAPLSAQPTPGEQQTITVSLWNSSMLSGGVAPLASGTATGGSGWVDIFWAPITVAPSEMYYLQLSPVTPGGNLYYAGGGSYGLGDALEFNGGEWRYMTGGPAIPGQVKPTLNADFTFRTYTDLSASATQVPGPLPVLGALAAFGWSRKMRQRIREAHAA